jgi:uncharacterized protein YjiS (DUF1127 family)
MFGSETYRTLSSGGIGVRLAALADALLAWQERGRQRRDLIALNDHQLHDIGISRADAEREWNKPFWRS